MSHRELTWAALVAASTPITLPEPWQQHACHPAFRQLPGEQNRQALLEQLLQEHPREALEQFGWLAPSSSESSEPLRLHPAMLLPSEVVMTIENGTDGTPPALYTGAPWVGAPLGGLAAPLFDHRAPRARTDEDFEPTLFVVFSMMELACFWSVGLPAILGTELANVTKKTLRELSRQWQQLAAGKSDKSPSASAGVEASAAPASPNPKPDGTAAPASPNPKPDGTAAPASPNRKPEGAAAPASPPPPAVDDSDALFLTLVDFDAARLDGAPRPEVMHAHRHLQRMGRCCDMELKLRVWNPSAKDLDDLNHMVRFADADDVAYLIAQCADEIVPQEDADALPEPRSLEVDPQPTYAEAQQQLEAARRHSVSAYQVEQKWHAQREAYLREVVTPMRHSAAAENDPLIQGHWTMLADAYGEFQLLQYPLRQEEESRDPRVRTQISAEIGKQKAQLLKTIQEMTQRIRECPHSNYHRQHVLPARCLQRAPVLTVFDMPVPRITSARRK